MTLRLYGHKLPPLATKPKILPREYSDEDKASYAEDNEDVPLLMKSINERKTSDIKSSIKDNCNVSSNTCRHGFDDKEKLLYNSTEVSQNVSCFRTSGKPSGVDDHSEQTLPTSNTSSPSFGKSDDICNYSKSFQDGILFSVFEANIDPDLKSSGSETFEMCITNLPHKEYHKMGTMCRSVSSFENSQSFPADNDQKSQPHGGEQRRYRLQHKRPAITRSRSESLATDENEYSKYWRGEVTVVEMQGVELPQTKCEQTLDDKMAASAITRSIIMGSNRLVLECLKQGEDPHLVCTKTDRSYFHVVASTATVDREIIWVPIIYQLSNAGVAVDTKDVDGQSAVRIAIKRRLVQVLAALLKCGAEFDAADEYHTEQVSGVVKSEMMEVVRRLTPSYWSAIDNFTHFKINRLIKAWSRVNISRRGQTLIEYAKQHTEDVGVVKQLIHNEASIELAHAVMAGDAERVKVMLCDGAADLATTDTSVKNNLTPLSLLEAAIKYDHHNIVKVLKEASKPKPSVLVKTDPYTDVRRCSCADSPGLSQGHLQDKSTASSSSRSKSSVYYGSSSLETDSPGAMTSTMCAIL